MQRGAPRFFLVTGHDQPSTAHIPGALNAALTRRGGDVVRAPSRFHALAELATHQRSVAEGATNARPAIVILLEPREETWAREFHACAQLYAPHAAVWRFDPDAAPQLAGYVPGAKRRDPEPSAPPVRSALRLTRDEPELGAEHRIIEPVVATGATRLADAHEGKRESDDDAPPAQEEDGSLVSEPELAMLLGGSWPRSSREPSAGAEG